MSLGNRIKQRRQDLKLSQEYLADQLGISRQAVSKWESNQSRPNTQNLIDLAEILKVDLETLTNQVDKHANNQQQSEEPRVSISFAKRILFIVFGLLFFVAYILIVKETFHGDYKSVPWIFLTVYMAAAVFCFPDAYHRFDGLDNKDYFVHTRFLMPVIYLASPILILIQVFKNRK